MNTKMPRCMLIVIALVAAVAAAPAAAAPIPDVTLGLPATTFIGEDFSFTATFDNASLADPGFGPFVDVIFPINGVDGAAGLDTADGVDFVNATYLGVPVVATQLIFPDDDGAGPGTTGCVDHPYAVDITNTPVEVCGTAGDKLVVLQLPFGSFTNDQPPAEITVNATGNVLADLNGPLPFTARAGFQYGADPLYNPDVDPSILSDATTDSSVWSESGIVTPILVTLSKANDGPEGETATGPNFPRRWTIDIEVAEGQTVTDLDVLDDLPNNVAFLSMISTNPAATIITTPPVGIPSNPPTNVVHINFASVTGTGASPDAQVVFEFFVPQFDANGPNVIDPATGDDEVSQNEARALGDWTPVDVRDLGGVDNVDVDPVGFEDVLEDKSIAIQKGGAIVIDVGGSGTTPGDTIEYTLEFQISDYFTFRDIVINDILSDGQRFDAGFTPTLSVTEHGAGTAGVIALANFSVFDHFTGGAPPVPPIDGTQEIEFRVSDELVLRALDDTILGGCVPAGGTGGPAPDCDLFDGGGSIATVTYRAVIQQDYTDDFPSGDSSIDHGDVISNAVVIEGTVLDNADVTTPTGFVEDDDSGAGFVTERGVLFKSIYAINGVIGAGPVCIGGANDDNACTTDSDCAGARCLVEVAPGYTITYRLLYDLPSSDIEDFSVIDFLPLPVLLAPEVTGFVDTISAAAPAAGTGKFGPDDTFRTLSGIVPTVSTDAVANSVTFDYGTFDDPLDTETMVDILFTVTITADPFADGLFLTNQARAQESNTQSEPQATDAIVQIALTEPVLALTKGVVSTDSVSALFTPAAVAPQPFTGPGSGCPRFGGVIHSNGLAATPIDSNVSGVETGNVVTYALVIENTGSTITGAFDVQLSDFPAPDMVPTGFGVGGINLCVSDGTGAAVGFTDLGGGLLGAGIELNDPGATLSPAGAIDSYHPLNGRNVIVITYDMLVSAGAEPDEDQDNVATLFNYAGIEGGPDFTLTDLTDDAQVSVTEIATQKSLVATSEAHTSTGGGAEPLAIGEIVRFRLEMVAPQSSMPNLQFEDLLPTGLTFLNDGTATLAFVSTSGALTSTTLAGPGLAVVGNEFTVASVVPTFMLPGAAILGGPFASGTNPIFSLGSVSNLDNDPDTEFIVLEFNALADNSAAGSNDAGDTRSNRFNVIIDGVQSGETSNAVDTRIVEPLITDLDISAIPTTVDAGDVVTFTITYSNPAGANVATAFDAAITNPLPAGLILNLGSVAVVTGGGAVGVNDNSAGNTVSVTLDAVPPGGTVQITYTATVANTVTPLQVLNTTADLEYTTLPGGNGTVVNATGSSTPGASGADNGERDGTDGIGGIDDLVDSDPASVTVVGLQTLKTVVATSEAHTITTGGIPRVAIGEIVRYRLQTRISEATLANFQLVDSLPTGLVFLDDGSARVAFVGNNGGITSSTLGAGPFVAGNEATIATITPVALLPGGAISGGPFATGTDPTFSLGTISNVDNDVDNEYLVVEFNALVDNSVAGSNDAGENLDNSYRALINGVQSGATSAVARVRIQEPSISNLDITANPTTGDAGDTIAYRITYSNTTGANVTTAFDALLLNTLPADLTLNLGSIVITLGGGSAGATNNSAGNTVDVTVATVPPGGTVRIDYIATLNGNVEPRQVIDNTADVTYTSLPGGSGTLGNPTGSNTPGFSGADDGERDGSGGINDYADTDVVSVTVPDPNLIKALTATSEATTDPGDVNAAANPPVAIGEILSYRLAFDIVEGVTQGVTLVDIVPAGLTLVPGSALLDRSSAGLTSLNNPGAINANVPGIPVPVTLNTATPGQLRLLLGNVTNSDTDNGTTETYILTLQMVVGNTALNNAGTLLSNTGRIEFLDANAVPVGLDTGSVDVHVAEPVLAVTKDVDSPTKSGGDIVVFDVVLTNSAAGANAATAFDWVFTDALLPQYQAPSVVLIDAGATGATVSASFTGNTLNGTIDQLDPGESVTVRYQATVDPFVFFGQTVTNTVAVDATSLPDGDCLGGTSDGDRCTNDLDCPGGGTCLYATPGAPGSATGERTGSGGVNDLSTSDDQMVVIDTPSLIKTNLTPAPYDAIGETATFRIITGVPIGMQNEVVFTDTLPVGLSYVPGSLVVVTPAMTSSTCIFPNPPCDDTNAAFFQQAGSVMNFDFGDIAVSVAGNIAITYDVVVDDILTNQDGTLLFNTVFLEVEDPDDPLNTLVIGPVDNDIPVRVGEPDLEMVKAITAGAVGADAGDTVSWQVQIENAGNTTAFQVDWSDTMPNGLFQIANVAVGVSGANVFLNGTATTVTAGDAVVSTVVNANDTLSFPDLQIEPGARLTVTFDSTVMNTVTPGQVLTNDTRANYTSLVGGGRDNGTDPGNVDDDDDTDLDNYEESATQGLTIASELSIDKSVSPTVYTIGEDVTYTIRVDFIEGTTPSLNLTDILPAGLTYQSHMISLGNGGISFSNASYNTRLGAGQTVRFNFGNILNPGDGNAANDFITIALTARVGNIVANQDDDLLRNGEQADGSELYVEYGPGPTRVDFDADSGTAGIQGVVVEVVEPDLSLSLSVAPTTAGVGQEVNLSLNVAHTGNSAADAFDTRVTVTLPAGLTYVPGSASLPPADVTVIGQTVTFNLASLTEAEGSQAITFRATLDAGVAPNQVLQIPAQLVWSSLPGSTGAALSGRTGTDGIGGALNDYAAAASGSLTTIGPDLTMFKSHSGPFKVGTEGTFVLAVKNQGQAPTSGAITVTDSLIAGLTYVSASGSGWTCGAAGQLVTCTNPGPLGPNTTTVINLIVAVGSAAFPSANNTASVSTANDTNLGNNSDSVSAVVKPADPTPTPTRTPTPAGPAQTATAAAASPTPPAATATPQPTATPTQVIPPTATATPFLDVALVKTNTGNFFTCATGVFDYSVRNMGHSSAQTTVGPLTITDSLPLGLSYVGFAGAGWDCSAVGQVVTCVYPAALPPNATTYLAVTVYVGEEAYPTINSAARVSTPFDSNPQNDYEQESTTVRQGSCGGTESPTVVPTATAAAPTATATAAPGTPTAGPVATPTPTQLATPSEIAAGCGSHVSTRYIGVPRPGSTIEYRLSWSHTCRDLLDLTAVQIVPVGMEIVSIDVRNAASSTAGNVVTFAQTAQAAGLHTAVVRARILPTIAPGELLCGAAFVEDSLGRSADSEACLTVLGDGQQLRTELHAHLLSRPGRQLSYTARYFGVQAENRLEFTLPAGVTILDIQQPLPDSIAGRVLVWENLPAVSGKIRLTVQLDYTLLPGTILPALMDFQDSVGREFQQHDTLVVAESSPSGESTIGELVLVGPRSLRPGQATKIMARYKKVADSGTIVLDLPPGVHVLATIPTAEVGLDGSLRWQIAGAPTAPVSGSVKAKVLVGSDVPPGSVLSSYVSLTTASAAADAESLMVVKNAERRSLSSATISAPRKVVPGMQSQLSINVKKMPAPVTVELTLPPQLVPTLMIPAGTYTESGKLRWTITGDPGELVSAKAKVKVLVAPETTAADLLSVSVTTTSAFGELVSSAVMEVKPPRSSAGVGGGGLALTMSGSTSLASGAVTTLKVKYSGASASGRLEVLLPPGLGPVQLTVPTASHAVDGRLEWADLRTASGSVSIKVMVNPTAPSGQLMTVAATLSDAAGNTTDATFGTAVR